jgi:uncharacterized protein (TIGR02646 family)
MSWLRIDKKATVVPTTGTYQLWKSLLADEGKYQCVYCCINESQFGGFRNFHVEHFRPKSLFRNLENDFSNLFYACGVCNSFKGNDWPNEPTPDEYEKAFYPNPSELDYSSLLRIEFPSGLVASNHYTGRYLIERLHLNRPYSITVRRFKSLNSALEKSKDELIRLYSEGAIKGDHKDAVIEILFRLSSLMTNVMNARPYEPSELR